MKTAKVGDRVRVQYLGVRQNGTVADSGSGRRVLEFTVGTNEVIPGIDQGVVGMVEGEQKRLTLEPHDAYGAVNPLLIKEVLRERFPAHLRLRVGKLLNATGIKSRRRRIVKIAGLTRHTVVVDGNHPLAGEALEVEIQLVSLSSPSTHMDERDDDERSASAHPFAF